MTERKSLLFDNEYVIMSEVAENESVTQRQLSKKLGISVSTVNVLINKMIREGLIKMTQVSQKQVLYMLTPAGIVEKTKKTAAYLKAHYRAIYETKEKIKTILHILVNAYDVIYVLMCNDEIGEIFTLAIQEYKAKHKKVNIKIVQSVVDIDIKAYKSPVLLLMTMDDEHLMEEIINDYNKIDNLKIINLAEKL